MDAMTAKQLHAVFPNRVGLLADICGALAQANVNIMAICAYEMDGRGEFLLVTNDNSKAMAAMVAMGGEVTESGVIGVELDDRVGALAEVARKIADAGIDIGMTYAANYGRDKVAVIISTTDDAKALGLLAG